ncbi:DinB family protein [Nonomuraea sp. NPDC050310]|uniref:DinB family protein n=1 Tax=Nonomuraea sp. NPDC050310 TaxID=3154935 RepID=UPI0033DA8C11
MDWNAHLRDQLDWHWTNQLRPRFDGLSDEEYLWEPVPGSWNVRRREAADPVLAVGSGAYVIDYAPEADPPPVTTIAWRLAHLVVGVFGLRVAAHFGGPPVSYDTFDYTGSAEQALAQLDAAYAAWNAGVAALGEDGLLRPCGEAEGMYAERPLADLVLHINREAIHHGAEVSLLRDLYLRR